MTGFYDKLLLDRAVRQQTGRGARGAIQRGGPFSAEPTHLPEEIIGTEIRPVVCDGFIEERDVLVTKDQPLGIWMIDGKPAVT